MTAEAAEMFVGMERTAEVEKVFELENSEESSPSLDFADSS